MNRYEFELEHDNGQAKIIIIARNIQSAVAQVMNAEGCPESAIVSVKIKPIKK